MRRAYDDAHRATGKTGEKMVTLLERRLDATVGFWQLIFNDDSKAKDLYVGSSCGLCGHSTDYEFGENGF